MACCHSIIQYRSNIDWPLIPEPAKAPLNTTKMALNPNREEEADKCLNVAFQRQNGENYQRALTLLNEATETSDHLQPQLSRQSAVTAFTAQDPGTSERREMARLFPFYRQGATAGVKTSSCQPHKRFRSSALSSGVKRSWIPKETWTHTFVCIAESDQLVLPSRDKKLIEPRLPHQEFHCLP